MYLCADELEYGYSYFFQPTEIFSDLIEQFFFVMLVFDTLFGNLS